MEPVMGMWDTKLHLNKFFEQAILCSFPKALLSACQKVYKISFYLFSCSIAPLISSHWPFFMRAFNMDGLMNPPASNRHQYFLVTTDCFTKWMDVITLKMIEASHIVSFTTKTLFVDLAFLMISCLIMAHISKIKRYETFAINSTSITIFWSHTILKEMVTPRLTTKL